MCWRYHLPVGNWNKMRRQKGRAVSEPLHWVDQWELSQHSACLHTEQTGYRLNRTRDILGIQYERDLNACVYLLNVICAQFSPMM